jgi:hypothetical protein
LSAAQQPAPCDHPHATPARRGRGGDGHRVAPLELGTTAEARLCTGYGTLFLVSAWIAADHRDHHARRGDPKDPPASETRGGPTPHCPSARPPRSLRLDLRLTAPGVSRPVPGSRRLVLSLRSLLTLPVGGEGGLSCVLPAPSALPLPPVDRSPHHARV